MTNAATAVTMQVLAQLQACPDLGRVPLAKFCHQHQGELRFLLYHKPPDVVADLLGFERWEFRRACHKLRIDT